MCWVFVILPIGILIPSYRFQAHDVVLSLLASALSIGGYYIWFGWGFYWKNNRFPLVTVSKFWSISLAIHTLWLFAFPYLLKTSYAELLEDIAMTFYLGWIATNIVIAAVLLVYRRPTGELQNTLQNKAPHRMTDKPHNRNSNNCSNAGHRWT